VDKLLAAVSRRSVDPGRARHVGLALNGGAVAGARHDESVAHRDRPRYPRVVPSG